MNLIGSLSWINQYRPITGNMNNTILITLVIVIIIIAIVIATAKAIKRRQRRTEFVTQGTQFEAHIVGVAHPERILNIEGQPNHTINVLGTEWTDVTAAERAESRHRIRVKISYVHPFTRQQTIVHRILDKEDYTDDRLIKVGNPGTLTLGSKSIAYMKHNKKLYETYVQGVNARNISPEEKKHLIREAMLAMNNQNDEWTTDHEGYNVLTPPVIAEGYLLNDDLTFIQKTNTPIFQDWTLGLR
jgi:hypothetical protein